MGEKPDWRKSIMLRIGISVEGATEREKFHGPSICQRIGLNNIRQACPRFHSWLIRLESLTKTL
jgi:hypothetical protein